MNIKKELKNAGKVLLYLVVIKMAINAFGSYVPAQALPLVPSL